MALLDAMMPDRNGLDIVQCLREIHPDVHIMLMSGYNEQEIRQRTSSLGHFSFIQKPFLASSLIEAVESALEPIKVRRAG